MNKKDFPLFKNLKKRIHYLDNAATTQKPSVVIEAQKKFYENMNANPHRGVYSLAERATEAVEEARQTIANFINADPNEIIFTRNTTDSLNLLARSVESFLRKQDNIMVTELEHHSNFVPWQQLAKRKNLDFKVIKFDHVNELHKSVNKETAIVSFTAMSNVTGFISDAKKIIKEIKKKNPRAIIIIDAAQAIAHRSVDVKKLDCDFLAFSMHKVYGPMGIGILYGKQELLEKIDPAIFGGHMISKVTAKETTWAEVPAKFEAGTLDAAGITSAAEAIKYLKKIGFKKIEREENKLQAYLLKELKKIKGMKIYGHDNDSFGPVVSFNVKGIHPHDMATIADNNNVSIRAGHHCAQPLMNVLNETATCRASLSFYNDERDVDALIKSIKKAIVIINGKK